MPTRSAAHVAARHAPRRRGHAPPRTPSTAGYMLVSGGLSFALFLLLWFWLRADGGEAPWLPAGLAAGCVVLLAAAAREVVMRRAWARYAREMELAMGGGEGPRPALKSSAGGQRQVAQASVAALRALQQRLAELDGAGATPESHLEAFRLCEQFLANVEEAMRTASAAEMRAALRAGQERVRALKRKHLLLWARGEATRLTHEAQRRVRATDKIETAQRALEVLEEALRLYPEAQELRDSAVAVRDFIASVKVGQWVEMAERAAFRGRYARAIARYRDALFYLTRAEMGEDARHEAAARIEREIELLRARLDAGEAGDAGLAGPPERGAARRKAQFPDEARLAGGPEEAEL